MVSVGRIKWSFPWGHSGFWWGCRAGMLLAGRRMGIIWFMNSTPDDPVLLYLSNLLCDYAQDVTEIEELSNPIADFYLEQNFPNPLTQRQISPHFRLRNADLCDLKVYDILGNSSDFEVNEEKPAGTYKVEFGRNLINQSSFQNGLFLSAKVWQFCSNKTDAVA
ncbi:MAG: hypothetical protein MZV64_06520 [Ignavibacteriales bacterium]|nr:hypothetical protein [Ignavibacteriales bacterium]